MRKGGPMDLVVCGMCLPRCDGCGAGIGEFCGLPHVNGGRGDVVEWQGDCAAGWWYESIAGNAW